MFPPVVVINLAERPDRLAAFRARFAAAAPGVPFTVHTAVRGPQGAAGCLASHLAVLGAGRGPTLVLEDDAVFSAAFTLDPPPPPGDWVIAWLGGQHRAAPLPVDGHWERPTRLLRTHAYVVADPPAVGALLAATGARRVDPCLAALPVPQYSLRVFTVGQAAGVSDIDGRVRVTDQFWRQLGTPLPPP